jgi:hypothetical protein
MKGKITIYKAIHRKQKIDHTKPTKQSGNTMSATSGTRSAYPTGAPAFTPGSRVLDDVVFLCSVL